MTKQNNGKFVDLPPNSDSPMNYAVSGRDKSVLDMVAKAIAHKETLLAFQPVARTLDPCVPIFYEGLMRVLDDTGRVIPAKDFMPVAENTEMGRELDCLALQMGVRCLSRNPGLRLSINMSARSIGFPRWMRILDRSLTRNPTIGARLILEITESSALLVPELVVNFMNRLQSRGISFALDDFGAGHTSFRHLRDFYFDIVKIDGQFIRDISTNPDNQVLVRALVSIAEQFDMITVAEHVETAENANVLNELNIDCLQGFYIGPPTTTPSWRLARTRESAAPAWA